MWNAILTDSWMWIVVWGKPRTGKTTVQLKCAFDIYQDWDLVIQSCVFNLNNLLYKMKKGEPCRIPTLNRLHMRIPIILADDFGAQCNKAKTQHEQAWDIVKGAWDTFGTKVAIVMASMGNPSGLTQQLQDKYTHEVYVEKKGIAKYDTVQWYQNFGGWQAKQNKTWIHSFEFEPVPTEVYKQYDEMRLALVDELIQQIDDAQIENEGAKVFRRLTDKDVEFIELMFAKGQIQHEWFRKPENDKWLEVLKRCKARGIIVPVRKETSYWYDLTDFGFNLLTMIQAKKKEGQFAPQEAAQEKVLVAKS